MSKETLQNQETKPAQQNEKRSSQVKLSQLLATALAAVTAAFLGSRLGVAGTITGAGVASVVSTVGTALYQRSLERTTQAALKVVRTRRPDRIADATTVWLSKPTELFSRPVEVKDRPTGVFQRPAEAAPVGPPTTSRRRRFRLPVLVGATALAFALGMGVVTGIELLTHRPLSGGDAGTTISGLFGGPTQVSTNTHPNTPTHDTTTHPAPTTTPTPSSSDAPTSTPTPSTTPAPSTTTPPPSTTTTAPPTSASETTTGKQGAP